MSNLSQNLYITYSNQKVRDLKRQNRLKAFDKVLTLDTLIIELFENNNFKITINETIASSIIYNIIQSNKIEYFSYLSEDSVSLNTIYNFIIKCKRNLVPFETLLSDKKLDAIIKIDKKYQEYKHTYHLIDIADIELAVLENWDTYFNNNYNEIYVDSFKIGEINYLKSKNQKYILDKFSKYKTLSPELETINNSKIIKPSNEVFDNIDEVKTAIRITRKLLENDTQSDDILIVASDIQEYAPLYKLFLNEYMIKGFSSIGTPLSSFYNTQNQQVQIALNSYEKQIKSLTLLYKQLNLTLTKTTKENIKNAITILDEKIGIEITESNQIVGLSRRYKHIIFIGTDINHFPPKASENFLYSYDDDLKFFYANNYFTSSQTQLNELKRLSDNLYIVTASYSGKRELTPSILIDSEFDETIDISDIKSVNQLALNNQTQTPDLNTSKYYESISSQSFTTYDGNGVQGLEATHLSASQINKYLSCPLAYLYQNKVKLKAPSQPEDGFDAMEQGSLMHLSYELFGRYIKKNSIKSLDVDTLYDLMYKISFEAYYHKNTIKNRGDENIHHKIFLSTLQSGLKDDRHLGLLAKFVDYYIERADEFEFFKNTEFEKEFALDNELKPYKLKNNNDTNYFIKGYIDRFDNLNNQINIIDYKSKKILSKIHQETQDKIDNLEDIQLSLYILYASQEYPDSKYIASLVSFKADKKSDRKTGKKEYNFTNLCKDRENETYNSEFETSLKELIFATKENIENGKFGYKNSDEKICEWCDIKYICHEGVLNKKIIYKRKIK
jgi:RecB family exonuclease